MNPGFVRIALSRKKAIARFQDWIALPEVAKPRKVAYLDAVDAATQGGEWRGDAVSFYESDGWTLFEDHSGVLVDQPLEDWLRLADKEALVFASYNDTIPMGELVVVERGKLVRELRDDPARPDWFKNAGRLPEEGDAPWSSWSDVAGFVDEDDVFGAQPDAVHLWIFRMRPRGAGE